MASTNKKKTRQAIKPSEYKEEGWQLHAESSKKAAEALKELQKMGWQFPNKLREDEEDDNE